MSYCKIKPDSPLYDRLEAEIKSRTESLVLYGIVTSKDFITKFNGQLEFTENGEPTYESVLPLLDLNKVLSKETKFKTMENTLNKTPNLLISDLVEKAVMFNKEHKDHIAIITTLATGNSHIKIEAMSNNSEAYKQQLELAYNSYKKIDAHLNSLGIPITILNSEVMKSESALFNPAAFNESIKGLYGVINIANNIEGYEALTEEYAHLILESLRDNPIIRRLENLITEDIAREVLGKETDTVVSYYMGKNRPDLIAREVLGRIYAQQLQGEQTTNSLPQSLLSRGLTVIKNFINKFFKLLNITSVSQQLEEIRNELRTNPLTKVPETSLTPKEIQYVSQFGEMLAHTKDNVTIVDDILTKILTNLGQNISMHQNQETKSDLTKKEENLFDTVATTIAQKNQIEGIRVYLNESMEVLRFVKQSLYGIKRNLNPKDGLNPGRMRLIAKHLREVKSNLDAYQDPILAVKNLCDDLIFERIDLPENLKLSDEELQILSTTASQIYALLYTLENTYKILGKEALYHFYKDFFSTNGEDILMPNGTPIKLMQIFDEVDGDIGLLNRWIQSAAESNDMLIQLTDRAIQDKQQEVRQKTQETVNKIIELDRKFKMDGGGSTDFIYEKDVNGVPTRYLLSPYNYGQYQKDKQQYIENDPTYKEADDATKLELLRQWDDDHQQEIVETKTYKVRDVEFKSHRKHRVPLDTYASNQLDKLSPVQRRYYDEYMQLKNELEWLLPASKSSKYMAVQKMVESAQEIILNQKVSTKQKLLNTATHIVNKFKLTQNDEVIYGKTAGQSSLFKKVLINFDKTVHQQIPIYYTSLLEDPNLISTDASAALLDYAIMAHNYSGMHEIVDFMEITKDIAAVRDVKRISGNRQEKNFFTYKGTTFESDAQADAKMTKTVERLNEVIETQIYGVHRVTSDNTLLKFNIDKAMDALVGYTAFSMLGYNAFTGFNNILVGKMQIFIESMGGEFFTFKEWQKGDAYYAKHLPEFMSELHSVKNTTKLGLIGEFFNVGLSWKEKLKNKDFYATDVTNAINALNSSFMLSAGEHHMQMSTALAMLNHIKVKDSTGKELSLLDALEVETNDYKGKTLTATLNIKKGVTNLDGSEISKKQLRDISLQIGKVNQELHGIYNSEDAMGLKRFVIGRAITMYRNFIMPTINKRFKGITGRYNYNFYHNMFMEGTYTSTYKILKQLIQHKLKPAEIAKVRFSEEFLRTLPENEQKYLRHQKANLKRFATEFFSLVALSIAIAVLFGWDDDNKEDATWSNRTTYYFLKRLQLEMAFYMTPFSVGETLLVSPTPILTPIKRTMQLMGSIFTGYDTLENGPYRGHTELYRDFMKWLPMYSNIYDFFTLHEDDKRFKIFE